ncbi:MAG: transglutaminase-like cysteine peptidase [Pseudomonadales bacterium]
MVVMRLIRCLCLFAAPALVAYDFSNGADYLAPSSQWPAWHNTMERASAEANVIRACLDNKDQCERWLRSLHVIIDRSRALTHTQQLQIVNRYINQHRHYRRDRRSREATPWGDDAVFSQWSTLLEFLQKGGDCEDYATAKYMILRLLGYTADVLRIVVVYDRKTREYHAVVAVHDEQGNTRLLDIDNRIYGRKPTTYRYVYAVNEDSIWDHSVASTLPKRRQRRIR